MYFGPQGMLSAFTNIIYAKIGNRLVPHPPPLNKVYSKIFRNLEMIKEMIPIETNDLRKD